MLYVIINRESTKSPLELCEKVLLGGADIIQLRDKKGGIILAEEMLSLCKSFHVPFLINDYVTLAKEIGADGVHLGQEDLGLREAREMLGKKAIIGATAPTVERAKIAEKMGADYLGCGHIYPTTTKKKTTLPIGLAGLREVVQAVSIPVIAIGGIKLDVIAEVLTTGVRGVAMVSAIAQAQDPEYATREMKGYFHAG